MNRYRVGVLCYCLSRPSVNLIMKMAQAGPEFILKAYPIFGPIPDWEVPFAFRPSQKVPKTFYFNNLSGTAPENQIRTLAFGLVLELIQNSDMVCLLGIQGLPALVATAVASIRKKPVLAVSQTLNPQAEANRPSGLRIIKKLILRMSTYHIAQTPHTMETLISNYGIAKEKISMIPWDGGAEAFFEVIKKHEGLSQREIRKRRGLSESAWVVLFCGTLIRLKGIDVLLKAFANIIRERSDSLLLIAGPDGDRYGTLSSLMKLAESLNIVSAVKFLGQLSWEDLSEIYLSSDIFVLPTRKDTWGKVLVEAGLASLPIITTDVCGAAGYLVKNDMNGFVIPVDNAEVLTKSMLKLCDPTIRLKYGKASREIMAEYLNSDQERSLYKTVFGRCIG